MKENKMIDLSEKDFERAAAAKADTGYIGAGDALLDLGKASSFGYENKTCRSFNITFKNTSADKTVFVQFNDLISGKVEDKYNIIKNGIVAETLTIQGTTNDAALLAAYLKEYPSRIHSMKFRVDDPDQLDEPITLHTVNVFGNPDTESITPSLKHSENTNNPNVVDIDECVDWLCSSKSTILYGIRPGRTVNLTINFGASLDTAHYLNTKAVEARQTLAAAILAK